VTAFATALNDLRDLKETKDAERLKQKLSSKLALVVKNQVGGPMPGINPFGADTTRTEGNSVKTEEVGDVAIQYLFNGDSIEAHHSQSPGNSWFQLTELIIRDIAVGLDLPVEFVWNMAGLTGPSVRMTSKQAERTFKAEQDDLEEAFYNRIIGRWLANEVAEGRIDWVEGAEMWKVKRPSHPSIDAGRESAANLNERQAGVMSGGDIAEERGTDIDEVHAEIERESDDKLVRAKRLAEKHDIPMPVALSLMGVSLYADVLKSMIETTADVEMAGAESQPQIPDDDQEKPDDKETDE
jgi:capsid protein